MSVTRKYLFLSNPYDVSVLTVNHDFFIVALFYFCYLQIQIVMIFIVCFSRFPHKSGKHCTILIYVLLFTVSRGGWLPIDILDPGPHTLQALNISAVNVKGVQFLRLSIADIFYVQWRGLHLYRWDFFFKIFSTLHSQNLWSYENGI